MKIIMAAILVMVASVVHAESKMIPIDFGNGNVQMREVRELTAVESGALCVTPMDVIKMYESTTVEQVNHMFDTNRCKRIYKDDTILYTAVDPFFHTVELYDNGFYYAMPRTFGY